MMRTIRGRRWHEIVEACDGCGICTALVCIDDYGARLVDERC